MISELQKKDIGTRIRELRLLQGYTQSQFSEKINVSTNFLSEIENGKKGLSYETIINICETFSISADYLLFGKKTPDKKTINLIDIANNFTLDELSAVIEYMVALKKLKENCHDMLIIENQDIPKQGLSPNSCKSSD